MKTPPKNATRASSHEAREALLAVCARAYKKSITKHTTRAEQHWRATAACWEAEAAAATVREVTTQHALQQLSRQNSDLARRLAVLESAMADHRCTCRTRATPPRLSLLPPLAPSAAP